MFDIIPIKGGINAPQGFYADGVSAGLKAALPDGSKALDVAFLYSEDALIPLKPLLSHILSDLCKAKQVILC